MKLLGLLLVAGLLTGCAAVDNSDPIESTQSQPVEVATESPSEVTEESETEPMQKRPKLRCWKQKLSRRKARQLPLSQCSHPPPKLRQQPKMLNRLKLKPPQPRPLPQSRRPVESKYSMANIAKNDSTSSCWAAISGKAYDLTAWISRHPGGAGAIVSICGTDATSVFQGRHGGQSGPASSLSAYLLGDVGS